MSLKFKLQNTTSVAHPPNDDVSQAKSEAVRLTCKLFYLAISFQTVPFLDLITTWKTWTKS